MTDYLEEVLEHTRALLREIQRLERPLAGGEEPADAPEWSGGRDLKPEGEQKKPGPAEPAGGKMAEREMAGREAWTGPSASESGEKRPGAPAPGEARAVPAAFDSGEERARQKRGHKLPLLEQLERLERAALVWSAPALRENARPAGGAEWPTGQSGYPRALSAPGKSALSPGIAGAERAGLGAVNGGLASAVSRAEDETGWAERADRAFRRDSRRYDGGFFLY